jgi:hypothetical protein
MPPSDSKLWNFGVALQCLAVLMGRDLVLIVTQAVPHQSAKRNPWRVEAAAIKRPHEHFDQALGLREFGVEALSSWWLPAAAG